MYPGLSFISFRRKQILFSRAAQMRMHLEQQLLLSWKELDVPGLHTRIYHIYIFTHTHTIAARSSTDYTFFEFFEIELRSSLYPFLVSVAPGGLHSRAVRASACTDGDKVYFFGGVALLIF
jgi:hypothetical protein